MNPRNLAREAYEVLNYNQQLVQFADSKAGTLIVINSLFVAAAGASGAPASGPMEALRALYVIASAVAVVLCLAVVMSRHEDDGGRSDLIFFGDILKRPNAGHYASEFVRTPGDVYLDDMLRRSYVVAGIARRKFQSFGLAQSLTAVSGVLWLLANVINVL